MGKFKIGAIHVEKKRKTCVTKFSIYKKGGFKYNKYE